MEENNGEVRTIGIVNAILGAWLIISPYILGYTSSAARWNQTILGIVVLILAGLRAIMPSQQWLSFLTGLAAIWGIIAPFILSYNRTGSYWNEIVVTVIVSILAFWNSSIGAGSRHHPTTA